MKNIFIKRIVIFPFLLSAFLLAGCDVDETDIENYVDNTKSLFTSSDPLVVRNAQKREKDRQNKEWTNENIQAHPDLWLSDAIACCDDNLKKIEVQKVAFLRLKKENERKVSDAELILKRYGDWLVVAKKEYKKMVSSNGDWPVNVNSYVLSQDEFNEAVSDALDRVKLATDQKSTSLKILKKIELREKEFSKAIKTVRSQRQNLSYQLEKIRMNQTLENINELSDIIRSVEDMSIELAGDPTKITVEDMTIQDPNVLRDSTVKDFLDRE